MNKYLLMCSAAVLAAKGGSGVALASTTVHFHSSSGGSYCDYLVINNSGSLYAAVHHGGVTCATTSLQNDAGVLDKKGRVPGKSGSVQFADTTLAKAAGEWDGLDFVLATPFAAGAPFAIVANTNGTTAFVLASGVEYPAKAKPGAKKSLLHDAIEALRLKK